MPLTGNTGHKKLPKIATWHHRTTLSGCIITTKASEKISLNSKFGVWGTPANFNGFVS